MVADLYLAGASTRRVEQAIGQPGIESISKSQVSRLCGELDETVEAFRTRPLDGSPYPFVMFDALVLKVREQGRIVNVCVVHATGVNHEGYRESLGLEIVTPRRRCRLARVPARARRPRPLRCPACDQRCPPRPRRRDPLDAPRLELAALPHALHAQPAQAPAEDPQRAVAPLVRSIFDQAGTDQAHEQYTRVLAQLQERFPAAASLLEDAGPDLLAFTAFSPTLWRQLPSNNPIERLNREIRRRTDVVSIFPTPDSIIPLVRAVLREHHEPISASHRYPPSTPSPSPAASSNPPPQRSSTQPHNPQTTSTTLQPPTYTT